MVTILANLKHNFCWWRRYKTVLTVGSVAFQSCSTFALLSPNPPKCVRPTAADKCVTLLMNINAWEWQDRGSSLLLTLFRCRSDRKRHFPQYFTREAVWSNLNLSESGLPMWSGRTFKPIWHALNRVANVFCFTWWCLVLWVLKGTVFGIQNTYRRRLSRNAATDFLLLGRRCCKYPFIWRNKLLLNNDEVDDCLKID